MVHGVYVFYCTGFGAILLNIWRKISLFFRIDVDKNVLFSFHDCVSNFVCCMCGGLSIITSRIKHVNDFVATGKHPLYYTPACRHHGRTTLNI